MSHVFISYAHKDEDCVHRIARRLEAQGIPIWIDKYNIPGGEWWGPAIQEGIRKSVTILIFWSDYAKQSDHVADEIKWARQHQAQNPSMNYQIIPVYLESLATTQLPEELNGIHAVDLTDCESRGLFKALLHRLLTIDAVKTITRQIKADFDASTPLEDLPDVVSSGKEFTVVPVMTSVHCVVYLAGNSKKTLATQLSTKQPLQLCLHMKGSEGDFNFLEQVKEFIGENFFTIYVTPKPISGQFELSNTRQSEWLDIVNTTYAVAEQLLGRSGATLQCFSLAPAVLTMAIGTKFYQYWELQFFNHLRPGYTQVIDTNDL